jgi:hypothetical protein
MTICFPAPVIPASTSNSADDEFAFWQCKRDGAYPGPRTRGVRRTWAILGGLSRHEDFTETRS